MDIAAINSLAPLRGLNSINSKNSKQSTSIGFEDVLNSAMSLIKETNNLTNAAEQEEMKFALGNSDNIGSLMVAQKKANLSLQYTVAVRNAVMSAYREIMNLQF